MSPDLLKAAALAKRKAPGDGAEPDLLCIFPPASDVERLKQIPMFCFPVRMMMLLLVVVLLLQWLLQLLLLLLLLLPLLLLLLLLLLVPAGSY